MTLTLQKMVVSVAAAMALAAAGCRSYDDHHHDHGSGSGAVKAYTSTKCLASGEPLGDKPVRRVANGQEVKFCCEDCAKEFDKNPSKFLSKMK